MEEGMDWGVSVAEGTHGTRAAASGPFAHGQLQGRVSGINRSLANWLVLRGHSAQDVDVTDFADPALYTPW